MQKPPCQQAKNHPQGQVAIRKQPQKRKRDHATRRWNEEMLTQSPAQLPAHDIDSHIAMSRVNIANRNDEMTPTDALWDSGAFPKSHVSPQTLQNLGSQQGVNINRELHKTVSGNFGSIGAIKLKVQLGGRRCPNDCLTNQQCPTSSPHKSNPSD
mmetsp:Transcript_16504/g.19826  ORF Transcript_16504/g.19826 Transcript_16504/m.19826 type:complete len:155 (-) Transcript_16504:311-775(-)